MNSDSSERNPIDVLAEEFVARFRAGEHPSLSEFVGRAPQLEEQIHALFPALIALEQARPSRSAATGPYVIAATDGRPLDHLGDFRILREVGRGGMGVVYEAEQISLGRRVALKVLLSGRLEPRHVARFEREARAAGRLHHTNIVPVHGVGQAEGLHFYVMQFIHGLSLDEILEELRRLRPTKPIEGQPPTEKRSDSSILSQSGRAYWHSVARIGMQVAEALHHAHQQNILHRDVKPSNLILDAQGTVWVTDFGLAKTDDGEDLTHTGDVVGTLRYLAPERFKGEADVRSDVYSLGLTLYELLALRPAFDAKSRPKLVRQVTEAEVSPLGKLVIGLPRDLETIVTKATAREPGDRYRSAQELAADLHAFLEDRPIQARRSGRVELFIRWCRRNPSVASLSAMLLVTLLLSSIISGVYAIQLGEKAKDAEDAAKVAAASARREREENERVRRLLYATRVREANTALRDYQPRLVRQLLEEMKPRDAEEDLRGFEWHYLDRLMNSDLRTIRFTEKGRLAFSNWSALSADGRRVVLFHPRPGTNATEAIMGGWAASIVRIEVFDTDSRKRLLEREFNPEMRQFALSGDGRLLALADSRPRVEVWDIDQGKLSFVIDLDHRADGLAFDRQGKKLAVRVGDSIFFRSGMSREEMERKPTTPSIRVWDVESRTKLLTLDVQGFSQAVMHFTPDGTGLLAGWQEPLAVGSPAMQYVSLWDIATGRPRWRLKDQISTGAVIAFSNNGNWLATGDGKQVTYWNARTGLPEDMHPEVPYNIGALAFSPVGDQLAVADTLTCDIRVFPAVTRRPIEWPDGGRRRPPFRFNALPLTGHESNVTQLAFRADGQRLFSLDTEGVFKEWSLESSRAIHRGFPGRGRQAFGAAGGRMAMVNSAIGFRPQPAWLPGRPERPGVIIVWDSDSNKLLLQQDLAAGLTPGLDFSADGKRLAVWGQSVDFLPFMAVGDAMLGVVPPSESVGGLTATLWHLGGLMRPAPFVQVFDVDRNRLAFTLADRGPVHFSPDGRWLLCGNAFSLARRSAGAQMSFSHFNELERVSTGDWFIRDSSTGAVHLSGPQPDESAVVSAFDPASRLLFWTARASGQAEFALWDIAGRRKLWQFALPRHARSRPHQLTFSPDGRYLAALATRWPTDEGDHSEAEMCVWELGTDSPRLVVRSEMRVALGRGASTSVAMTYSHDSRFLAGGTDRGSIMVWDLSTGNVRYTLRGRSWPWHILFSPDGQRLLTTNQAGLNSPWPLMMEGLLWDMRTGQELLAVPLPSLHNSSATGLIFDGKRIVIPSGFDREIVDGSPR